MSVDFAAVQARLGASTVRRTANATAVLPAGARVDGVFTFDPATASLGTPGMATRDVTFRCLVADLTEPVTRGTELQIEHKGQATAWDVLDVTQRPELGQVELILTK